MKKNFFSFSIAMAIVAMATLGMVITSCSKDDDILASEEQQESSSLKFMSPPCDPITQSTDDAAMQDDTVYYSYFKRHYGGDYPGYVSYQFNFTSTQLDSIITPEETTGGTALSVGGMFTFFNQTAYSGATAKGCPCFVLGSGYTAARYTADSGYAALCCLEESDVENLNYSSDGTYSLPFLTGTHPASYFSAYGLKKSSAYSYFDSYLAIGRDWYECGEIYTPIWVIRISDGGLGFYYYAFCIDPYQNGDTGGANSPDPDENKWWSTINYKKLN